MSFGIGVFGHPLPSASRLQPRHLDHVRHLGAQVVGIYLTDRERAEPAQWVRRVREGIAESGLCCLYLVGTQRRLLDHSETERRRAVADVAEGIAAVAAVGAKHLLVGPGGFSDAGPWWYHPKNYASESRKAIVSSLRELGDQADAAGVGIAIEGYQGSVFESPIVMRELVEEAGSPAVVAGLDYVNFLTPPTAARFPQTLTAMIEALGPRLVALHVKDAIVEPRLAVHVEEALVGRGELDLASVLSSARRADVPALLEHLSPDTADDALSFLAGVANGAPAGLRGGARIAPRS